MLDPEGKGRAKGKGKLGVDALKGKATDSLGGLLDEYEASAKKRKAAGLDPLDADTDSITEELIVKKAEALAGDWTQRYLDDHPEGTRKVERLLNAIENEEETREMAQRRFQELNPIERWAAKRAANLVLHRLPDDPFVNPTLYGLREFAEEHVMPVFDKPEKPRHKFLGVF